jgi:hypothetical protein
MHQVDSMKNYSQCRSRSESMIRHPAVIAIAVAVFAVSTMLIVDHGPWNRPRVHTAEVATHTTTGEAARAAGAAVTPTAPKPPIEPVVPGPKPVQPANPAPP